MLRYCTLKCFTNACFPQKNTTICSVTCESTVGSFSFYDYFFFLISVLPWWCFQMFYLSIPGYASFQTWGEDIIVWQTTAGWQIIQPLFRYIYNYRVYRTTYLWDSRAGSAHPGPEKKEMVVDMSVLWSSKKTTMLEKIQEAQVLELGMRNERGISSLK